MHFPPGKSTAVQANAPYNNIGERFLLIFQKKLFFFLRNINVLLIFATNK
ncbi:hypothetical protein BACEGG_02082 [Bacteroides eggerthii DSM 20697]|jgi:hypothetical protein|nr:hypothetical protein BACEGG_02082 [Bacteroides eggerthii DSM 20697]